MSLSDFKPVIWVKELHMREVTRQTLDNEVILLNEYDRGALLKELNLRPINALRTVIRDPSQAEEVRGRQHALLD